MINAFGYRVNVWLILSLLLLAFSIAFGAVGHLEMAVADGLAALTLATIGTAAR